MIAVWMLRAAAVGLLLAAAGAAAERIFAWSRIPRRWLWAATIVGSVALAFVPSRGARGPVPSSVPETATAAAAPSIVVLAVQSGADAIRRVDSVSNMRRIIDGAPYVWGALSATLLSFLLVGYARMRRVRDSARRVSVDGVELHVVSDMGPAVVGLVHPRIVVPEWLLNATEDDRRHVIVHEEEHVRAKDHWLLAGAAAALVAMPWNVALWWQHSRLRRAIETDCDARVIARGVDTRRYGESLVRFAGNRIEYSLLLPAWRERAGELRARITAMTEVPPRAFAARAALLGASVIALTFIACETATSVTNGGDFAPRSVLAGWPAEGFYGFHELARVRVKGVTRVHETARLTITDGGGRIVPTSFGGAMRMDGDTVAIFTAPAEFRIENSTAYRLFADANGAGTEVEIEGTGPLTGRESRAGSARGVAPMLNFLAQGDPRASHYPAIINQLVTHPQIASMVIDFDSTVHAPDASHLAPGHLLVESSDSTPQLVRLVSRGAAPLAASREIRRMNGSATIELMTPVEITLVPGKTTTVRVDAVTDGVILEMSSKSGGARGAVVYACSSPPVEGFAGGNRGERGMKLSCR